MKKKIYRSLALLGLAAAFAGSLLIFLVLQVNATEQLQASVRKSADLLAHVFDSGSVDIKDLENEKPTAMRMTWIDQDGKVLYDTAGAVDNHANRPEVQAAFAAGAGEETRHSDTLSSTTYYYALRLNDGTVLRVSQTTVGPAQVLIDCAPYVIIVFAATALAAALLAGLLTRRLLEPIYALDVEKPLQNQTYEELTPLLVRIDHQNTQLEHQMQAIQKVNDDLERIMNNMSEGLVVLSSKGEVLSVNRAALQLLGRSEQAGKVLRLEELCAEEAFVQIADAARRQTACVRNVNLGPKVLMLSLSPVAQGGSILMMVDVTDRYAAEQMRREFSANVSHELKTPLQTISGSAEILTAGLVQEQDKQRFYQIILTESRRMNSLIGDIIQLSKLDEAADGSLPTEQVDLAFLCTAAAESLARKAQEKQITLHTALSAAKMRGVPTLLSELIYNLCDNAITYNRPGGKVLVSCGMQQGRAVVRVEDTGIGIPQEHQSRVFERFYRVDKSHSRATGGTGLGLSIVKHAARLHNGEIDLESCPEKGTVITVSFPVE